MVENLTTGQVNHLRGSNRWVAAGAILGLVGVGMGAFGAHGLQEYIAELADSDPDLAARRLDNWKTAAHYQLVHAIAMVLTGICMQSRNSKWLAGAALAFLFGILVFSGMLYLLVLLEQRILGAIVPLGGVSMMIGWALLAIGVMVKPAGSSEIN